MSIVHAWMTGLFFGLLLAATRISVGQDNPPAAATGSRPATQPSAGDPDEDKLHDAETVVPLPPDLPPMDTPAQRRLDDVIASYRRKVEEKPNDAVAHNDLGTILAQLGRLEEAEPCFRRVVELRPDMPEARNNLGNILLQRGQTAAAIEEYRRALKSAPGNCDANTNLGIALIQAGREADGVQQLRAALRLCPDHVKLLADLSWVLATTPSPQYRDGAEAVRLAERVVQMNIKLSNEGWVHPRYLDILAAAQAEAGQFERAVSNAEAAIRRANTIGERELSAEIERRLALYREGQAFHFGR